MMTTISENLKDSIYENTKHRKDVLSRKNQKDIFEVFNLAQSYDLPKLPKGIRKQTRRLKAEARKQGLSQEEIKQLFGIETLYKKEKKIKFNEITAEGEIYEGDYNTYQMEVIQKMFNFDWGDKFVTYGNKNTSSPSHIDGELVLKGEIPVSWGGISITNRYNGLDYLGKIPKEGTELFLVSKLLEQNLKKHIESIYNVFYYNCTSLYERIRRSYTNENIYEITKSSSIGPDLDTKFVEIVEYIDFVQYFSEVMKERYPEFQIPIKFDENGFDSEEYKKGIIFDALNRFRKEMY